MTDAAPAVALLFDDTELGGQLRQALHERGARIVHEGTVSTLSLDVLQRVGADVLVVNLDDSADDALDHLYDVIDGDRPRVVFNDAQASRGLTGWDRARWARHLAVKVLAMGDIDPPRPENAPVIDEPVAPAAATVETAPSASPSFADTAAAASAVASPAEQAEPPALPVAEPDEPLEFDTEFQLDANDAEREQNASAESEGLAAELEAMLASGDLPDDDDEADAAPAAFSSLDEELAAFDDRALFDTDAAAEPARLDPVDWSSVDNSDIASEVLQAAEPEAFHLDDAVLSVPVDASTLTEPAAAAEPNPQAKPSLVQAPGSWALVDDTDADTTAGKPEEENFGIEKLSATDFLAPEADSAAVDNAATIGVEKLSAADFLAPEADSASDVTPTMSLELVSMEEAVAPQAYVQDHEIILDDQGRALSRLILLGAASSGIDSVGTFLAGLPPATQLTFLLTQHAEQGAIGGLVQKFAAQCPLPVRLAEHGSKAAAGEVLVVPEGQHVRLLRDASVELRANGADAVTDASIDASLTMAASNFGRDAVAIVFAGRGNDAVAGAQAIHDRGGQVWVESSSGEHFADMVSGIFAERLVSFSGTPAELLAHLIEVFP